MPVDKATLETIPGGGHQFCCKVAVTSQQSWQGPLPLPHPDTPALTKLHRSLCMADPDPNTNPQYGSQHVALFKLYLVIVEFVEIRHCSESLHTCSMCVLCPPSLVQFIITQECCISNVVEVFMQVLGPIDRVW